MLTMALQGRRGIQRTELAGRERGQPEELEHARVLLRGHVADVAGRYIPANVPASRTGDTEGSHGDRGRGTGPSCIVRRAGGEELGIGKRDGGRR